MTVLGLDHVSLSVPFGREGEVAAFYSGVLGLDEIPVPNALAGRGLHWFALGTAALHVIAETQVARSVRHPAILVADLEPFRSRLEAAGISIGAEPKLPGCERFSFLDPFGNRVEILRRD